MDRFSPGHGILVHTVAGSTPNRFVRWADINRLIAPRRRYKKHFTNVFGQLAELLFAAAQSLLSLLAIGDIAEDTYRMPLAAQRETADSDKSMAISQPSLRRAASSTVLPMAAPRPVRKNSGYAARCAAR